MQHTDRPGAPYTRIWTADVGREDRRRHSPAASKGRRRAGRPTASAWRSSGATGEGKSGIVVANADGTGIEPLADVMGSNHPLPQVGERLAWSPDGRRIAFVSAMPGPEPDMEADPIVITRYWFRPASSAGGRFSDNRRLHLFVVDVGDASRSRQLTDGTSSEHSIDWSPDGKQLVYLSNREPDPDFFFNYDIFVHRRRLRRRTTADDDEEQRVRAGVVARRQDDRLSGLERPITSSETNMEDTHVWTHRRRHPGERRELGADDRQPAGPPAVVARRPSIYFTVQSRGSARLHRLPPAAEPSSWWRRTSRRAAQVGSFAVAKDGSVAYALTTPAAPAELVVTAVRRARRR